MLVAAAWFNAVLVPQIIKAAKAGRRRALHLKLVTLTVCHRLVTLITVACAWPIISVMGSGWTQTTARLHLHWCLPQIFYGLYHCHWAGAQREDAFGICLYMWSPVLNNVITICRCSSSSSSSEAQFNPTQS